MVKILACSDLHGNLPDYTQYEADILLIAGDIVPLQCQRYKSLSQEFMINKFKPWLQSINTTYKIFIGGNHDFLMQFDTKWVLENFYKDNIFYLQDSKIVIENKTIYGTPWCSPFGTWAFMDSEKRLERKYKKIPESVDILLTHDCPYNVNDVCLDNYTSQHIGNIPLRNAIIEKKPKYCISGHLHSATHQECILEDTKCYNVSILNEQYNIAYEPKILEI